MQISEVKVAMPQRRGTWLPINKRFFVRIWCVVMAAEGSRASRWQQLSITQWHRTLHETQGSSQNWDACQPALTPTRAIAVLFPSSTVKRRVNWIKTRLRFATSDPSGAADFHAVISRAYPYLGERSRCRAPAHFVTPKVGTPGPWRPTPQPRGGVSRMAYSTALGVLGLFGQA